MSKKKNTKIFISGIPGTGKTTIGNYLSKFHGFLHINLEDTSNWPEEPLELKKFVQKHLLRQIKSGQNIVVTWGFGPEIKEHCETVDFMLQLGLKMIWFDGNRYAAKKVFFKRSNASKKRLDFQMKQINNVNIMKKYQPIVINTFDANGMFKSKSQISKEVLSLI